MSLNAKMHAEARKAAAASVAYSFAFQPIVDATARTIISYEALIRGPHGEPAASVCGRVPAEDIHRFDADGRAVAIETAAKLGIACDLNLNFLPQGLLVSRDSLDSTLEAAARHGLPNGSLVIEITEGEIIHDHTQFAQIINEYRARGIKVAIDDFGAGYSGLNLLAEFQPDQIKIDMVLARGIDGNGPRQAIVRAIIAVCRDLGIDVIAEGIETLGEFRWFEDEGVRLFQGYLFAKPAFESLPTIEYPA